MLEKHGEPSSVPQTCPPVKKRKVRVLVHTCSPYIVQALWKRDGVLWSYSVRCIPERDPALKIKASL